MKHPVLDKRVRLLATLVVALALSVPAPIAPAPAPITSAPPPAYAPNTLHDLSSVQQFRDAFNADKGRPRIVLLLSPT